jgi:hypothetical protein
MMEEVRTSETSVYSNETTRCYTPEGSRLHIRRRNNLQSLSLTLLSTVIRLEPTSIPERETSFKAWKLLQRRET